MSGVYDPAHKELHALLDPKRNAVNKLRQELQLIENRDGMMLQESQQRKHELLSEMAVLEDQCDAIEDVLNSPVASSKAAAKAEAKARQEMLDADDSPFAHTRRLLNVESEEDSGKRAEVLARSDDQQSTLSSPSRNSSSSSNWSGSPLLPKTGQKKHSVSGWARSTHFVMSLLWHSRVAIPETALFDERGAIQDHLFCSSSNTAPEPGHSKTRSSDHGASMPSLHRNGKGQDIGVNTSLKTSRSAALLNAGAMSGAGAENLRINAPYVLRCNRQHTTLDHVFARLQKKSRLSGTPLCSVDRRQGSHGTVLSESGLDVRFDQLRSRFSRPEGSGDNIENGGDFCIQQYVEPIGGIRYEVTCRRQPPSQEVDVCNGAPAEPNTIAIDVVPSSYCDVYDYPSNYAPPSRFQQRGVEPPPKDLRRRMCTTALTVLRHAEVSHDVWMTKVVFEMVLSTNHNPKQPAPKRHKSRRINRNKGSADLGSSKVKDGQRIEVVVTGAKEAEWVMAPDAWQQLRAAPQIVRGTGREAILEDDIAFEASGFQAEGTRREEDDVPDDGNGDGGRKRRPSRSAGVPGHRSRLTRPESAPALGPRDTLAVRRQSRANFKSFDALSKSAHPHSRRGPQQSRILSMQRTLHAAAGSALESSRPPFGPTKHHPTELLSSGSAGFLSSGGGPSSSNTAGELAMPSTAGAARFSGGLSSGALSVQQLRRSGGLNGAASVLGKDRVGGDGGSIQGGFLTNIRVAGRSGRDELHVQLSTALRKAQRQCEASEERLDILVAKEEDYISKIAGLEAAHGRLRKTLRTTEANLETHQLDARQRINSLQKMLVQTQNRLTKSESNEARERSLRISKQRELESVEASKQILQVRHDELAKRLSLVVDMEKNGHQFRSEQDRLQADHDALRKTHEVLLSEAEELRQRLGMAEEELIQQRSLRHQLFTFLGDLSTPGVRPPKRVAGGYSTYPRPSRRNVAKAVRLVVDGEIADSWQKQQRRSSRKSKRPVVGVSGLRNMRQARGAFGSQEGRASPGGSIDTPGVIRQLRDFMNHKRTLYGREITSARRLFNAIDSDGDGAVTSEELAAGLQRLDMGLQPGQIMTLLEEVDADQSGTIELEEFVKVVSSKTKGKSRQGVGSENTDAVASAPHTSSFREGSRERVVRPIRTDVQ